MSVSIIPFLSRARGCASFAGSGTLSVVCIKCAGMRVCGYAGMLGWGVGVWGCRV